VFRRSQTNYFLIPQTNKHFIPLLEENEPERENSAKGHETNQCHLPAVAVNAYNEPPVKTKQGKK
jgi:hypothetical protein